MPLVRIDLIEGKTPEYCSGTRREEPLLMAIMDPLGC